MGAIVAGSGFLPRSDSVYADTNAGRLGKLTQPVGEPGYTKRVSGF